MHASTNLRFFSLLLASCLTFQSPQLFAANEIQSKSSSSQKSSASSQPAAIPAGGGNGAHNKAKSGQMMGGLLIGAGAITVAIGYSASPVSWPIVAIGMLEMAGGLVAMLQNGQAAKETAPNTLNLGGLTTGGGLGLGNGPDLPNGLPKFDVQKCTPPICSCNDAACSQPQINLPPKQELEGLMRSGTMPDGTTLDEALAKLNENYDKAKDAADAFNKMSAAGAFDPNAGGLSLDSTGSDDSSGKDNSGDSGVTLSGSVKKSGSDDSDDDFKTEPMIDALAKQRGDQSKALLMGMNAIDSKNGKILTIFERLTRAIQGKNDRDLILAKNEWIRKKALKNKKISVKLK